MKKQMTRLSLSSNIYLILIPKIPNPLPASILSTIQYLNWSNGTVIGNMISLHN